MSEVGLVQREDRLLTGGGRIDAPYAGMRSADGPLRQLDRPFMSLRRGIAIVAGGADQEEMAMR